MQIHQFEDKGLSIYSYLLISEKDKSAVIIDPVRNVGPYISLMAQQGLTLSATIETHPHADFVSGHMELHRQTGAPVYCSPLTRPAYPHLDFGDGQVITLGDFSLVCLETPGHSPDSICVLMRVEGAPHAVFTGDTLFIGDVGRPDLRENAGSQTATRETLARALYTSVHEQLMTLPDAVTVYPTHGAGSLCGKGLSSANKSTIGAERLTNAALAHTTQDDFAHALLADLPWAPKYFGHCVVVNTHGPSPLGEALAAVPILDDVEQTMSLSAAGTVIVDTRLQEVYKAGHLAGSINLMIEGKFETYLGSIVAPGEGFVLIASAPEAGSALLERIALIGYESHCQGIYAGPVPMQKTTQVADSQLIDSLRHLDTEGPLGHVHILDVRNRSERQERVIFPQSQHIPLPELRDRLAEIQTDEPIIVHCAAGYRSAAAASILQAAHPNLKVIDLGDAIKTF